MARLVERMRADVKRLNALGWGIVVGYLLRAEIQHQRNRAEIEMAFREGQARFKALAGTL
jgi:G:T-mismatch repair DNA endonuclease (very short patch repair protein)